MIDFSYHQVSSLAIIQVANYWAFSLKCSNNGIISLGLQFTEAHLHLAAIWVRGLQRLQRMFAYPFLPTLVRQLMFLVFPICTMQEFLMRSRELFVAQIVQSRDALPLSWLDQALAEVHEVTKQEQ